MKPFAFAALMAASLALSGCSFPDCDKHRSTIWCGGWTG